MYVNFYNIVWAWLYSKKSFHGGTRIFKLDIIVAKCTKLTQDVILNILTRFQQKNIFYVAAECSGEEERKGDFNDFELKSPELF